MTALSPLAKIPTPQVGDRADGPTAFSNLAKRVEDITVIPYANSVARTQAYAAITPTRAPVAGSVSYLIDTQSFEFYNGSVWTPILNTNLPRGVLSYNYANSSYPTNASYIPQAQERQITDLITTGVSLVVGRVYRIMLFLALVDGGPGASPTSGGATAHIRYTATTTAPTLTSSDLVTGNSSIVADAATTGQSLNLQRIWTPTATTRSSAEFACRGFARWSSRTWVRPSSQEEHE
jgi:hypothetical protein